MKKKGFTLVELTLMVVIIAIISLIAIPLVMSIVNKSKIAARKKSIDAYGKSIELAIISYLMDNGTFPTDISQLTIEYSGSVVECEIAQINPDTTVYLSGCSVGGSLVDYSYGENKIPTAVQVLLSKTNPVTVTNYVDENISEMYTFEHSETEQTSALTDYRYIGATPNNYVYFNVDEIWRIIGVFTVEDENGNQEQRIKILRNEKLSTDMSWDSNGVNEWSTASLNTYLNGDYYNNLNSDAKNMVADTKYYLGGSTVNKNINGERNYSLERGKTTYVGHSIDWIGRVGLMYPSDHIFTYALGVDDICYTDETYDGCYQSVGKTKSWIYNTNNNSYQWLLTPNYSNSQRALNLNIWGYIDNYYSHVSYGVRPTLYLISSVKIDSGDGSEQDPYRLTL